jgi:rsbT co-antagonist protein RsbR
MGGSESAREHHERLQRRIEELEQHLADSERKFRFLTNVTNEAIVVTDEGVIVSVSQEFEALVGYTAAELIGARPTAFVAPESRVKMAHYLLTISEVPYEVTIVRKDGTAFLGQMRARAMEYQGFTMRVGVLRDITAIRRDEEAQRAAAVQEEVIRAQAAMLAQLSTPLLPISERVVVLPLIGEVNDARAAQVIETLTRGVFAHRAAIAILDITGTTVVGIEVADMLVRAARAVQLLGAEVLLTGIRPEVAVTLVELGADLRGIITRGTLQQGVAYALTRAVA